MMLIEKGMYVTHVALKCESKASLQEIIEEYKKSGIYSLDLTQVKSEGKSKFVAGNCYENGPSSIRIYEMPSSLIVTGEGLGDSAIMLVKDFIGVTGIVEKEPVEELMRHMERCRYNSNDNTLANFPTEDERAAVYTYILKSARY
ncbi:MAG: hypothetical protein ABIB71_06235 [Candidatus Woesearchaeota archaeon]